MKEALAKAPGIQIVEVYDIHEDSLRTVELIAAGTKRYPDLLGVAFDRRIGQSSRATPPNRSTSGEDKVHLVRHDPAGARSAS